MKLAAQGLVFGYAGGPEYRDISLELEQGGGICALLGPNGAGKSALLRALAGILPLRGGRILWGDEALSSLSRAERARRMAYLPQELPASPLSVYETVLLGRTPHLRFVPCRRDHQAVDRALERLGLEGQRSRRQNELSGGERRKALLALALAQETPMLFLDEPAAGLDPCGGLEIYALLAELCREENKLILTAEHDLNLAARCCARIILLHQGRIAAAGAPEAVLTPERLAGVYGLEAQVGQADGRPFILPLRPLAARTQPRAAIL
ncbi:MAG: ABC transporter ATP-binding protein [Deltaproteobacteria bacterium]|jgi:iron complex transport system ATP-binding protein|nr:ABC transporter ATP-binding protein [Deltaproteobacteria bacterium]